MSIKLTAGERGSACVKLGEAALAAHYAQEAKTASENARAAAVHPPVIGENGNWQIWYQGSGYVDSGVQAEGPVGPQGPQGSEDAESVRVVSQTWSAEQQAQARSNIGAADKSLYQANGINISPYPNLDPDNLAIICASEDDSIPTEYKVRSSIVLGPGKYNCNDSIALGVTTTVTSQNWLTLDWIAPYLDEYVINGTTYKRFNPSINNSQTRGIGCLNLGVCKIDVPDNISGYAMGYMNVVKGGYSLAAGGASIVEHNYAATIGSRLKSCYGSSLVCGKLNNPISGDRFEVGNGTDNTHRSNAFRVTEDGLAIAKNGLAIEKGDGTQVTVTAAQLEALLALLN